MTTTNSDARPLSLPRISELPEGTRPQSRLLRDGPGVLSEAELIALVIGKDGGLSTAYEVVRDCGRVDYLTGYDPRQLANVPGMGIVSACRLLAAVELGRRVTRPREMDTPTVSSPSDAANLLMPDMMHLRQEQLKVVLLDNRSRVMGVHLVYQGNNHSIYVRIAEILRPAIVTSAAAIIVAHNHPTGDPSPSPEDVRITREVSRAGALVGVKVSDHIIIGMGRYVSMRERGLMGDE